MLPFKVLRHILVILLLCIFLVYLKDSFTKYNSELISVSVRESSQTSFEFPTLAVCGVVAGLKPERMFNPAGAVPPWIEWVQQDYIKEDQNTNSREKPKLVALSTCFLLLTVSTVPYTYTVTSVFKRKTS